MHGRWKIEKDDIILVREFYFALGTGQFKVNVYCIACIRIDMHFVEMFFIHLPRETSAFLAILYYLWMFICCSIGVPPATVEIYNPRI